MIEDARINELVRSYKVDGYLNIFIIGSEGSGKTIFGTQLLSKICEELRIVKDINMIHYTFNDFLISNLKVKYLENSFEKSYFNNKEEFKSNINIIEIFNEKILDKFEPSYYRIDILLDFDKDGQMKRGVFKLGNKKDKFHNINTFDKWDMYDKKHKALQDNMYKDFITESRRQRTHHTLCLPVINNYKNVMDKLYKDIINNNKDCIVQFNGRQGTGKSYLAKELHNKDNINWKKVLELSALLLTHQVLFAMLLFIIVAVGFIPYALAYGINMVILYEIYFKPIYKEIRKLW